ncbi:Crp/Fnr family transcriptional regulator [Alsobacter metallidurans]|uniref:Crp/Fnr family transcriptional regulator n=1 Tax=Alsobacter metallidurans TaxID=340221 RepID=A0A917I507_9HYPH|nr:helix-turn-helix domain-containing protein [Alsobacter metallidurans]GGH11084.1 Crp/Fnr family transcriptional regulator [Alsobacter metallidurans]
MKPLSLHDSVHVLDLPRALPGALLQLDGRQTAADLPCETDELGALFGYRIPEAVARGKALFWEGAPAEHIFQIVGGVLRLFRMSSEGRRVMVGFAFPGDVLSIAVKDHYLFTAEAVTPTRVRRISRERLAIQIAEQPKVATIVFDRMREELCAVHHQTLLLLCQTAEMRIVRFLLWIAHKNPGAVETGAEFALPMLRTDIADYLGLTMETVCRTMTKLRRNGLIVMRGPHKIRFPNPRLVKDVADLGDSRGEWL